MSSELITAHRLLLTNSILGILDFKAGTVTGPTKSN